MDWQKKDKLAWDKILLEFTVDEMRAVTRQANEKRASDAARRAKERAAAEKAAAAEARAAKKRAKIA